MEYEIKKVGMRPIMKQVFQKVSKIATTDDPVLIVGEKGIEKRIIVRAIHNLSKRKSNSLIEVNCALTEQERIEKEMFGIEKAASNGKIVSKKGNFEIANMGTVFLDEIGELSLYNQRKLLNVLQNNSTYRVGGEDSFKIDVRMISFTSLDLEEKISEGLFRDDLYYSINVMSIYIPPLRDRIEDIVPLTKYFIQKYSAKANDSVLDISKDSLIFIMEYKWLENIQQLENAIKSAVLMCDKNIIEPDDLPDYLREKKSKSKSRFQIENILTQKNMNYHEKLEACEKEIIKQALIETQYNKTQAAKKLGVTLRTLRNKLKKYNL